VDDPGPAFDAESARIVTNSIDGVVLAFDLSGLEALARGANCLIDLVPQVGDFVAAGDPLFRIYPGGTSLPTEVLGQSVCVGDDRTMRQDPTSSSKSSSTSPPRDSRRRSMTPPPRSWPSTRFTISYEQSDRGTWTRGGCARHRGSSGLSIERPTGRIS
jgi:hypothetical protein